MEAGRGGGHGKPRVSAGGGHAGLVMFVHSLVSWLHPR